MSGVEAVGAGALLVSLRLDRMKDAMIEGGSDEERRDQAIRPATGRSALGDRATEATRAIAPSRIDADVDACNLRLYDGLFGLRKGINSKHETGRDGTTTPIPSTLAFIDLIFHYCGFAKQWDWTSLLSQRTANKGTFCHIKIIFTILFLILFVFNQSNRATDSSLAALLCPTEIGGETCARQARHVEGKL
jgi:hypothetical protein